MKACEILQFPELGFELPGLAKKFDSGRTWPSKLGLSICMPNLIDKMPIEPSVGIWGALLGACWMHGKTNLAECAVKSLLELDVEDSGSLSC
ncbi:hypothetical protein HHK36_010492 [Tetracentron sinense]|uniref:Uncharacterized protein n=1 Tax=Tetracentron sinense TaxID=13715 RepID=A0A834ZH21_TETSI|nr:hypothetical protein HHK36_010492 [Tetracentron sinense]